MTLTASDRLAGLSLGLGLGPEIAALATGEQVLGSMLLEELSRPDFELGRVVARWVENLDRPFECPVVARSLAELARTGAPPAKAAFGPGLGAAVVALAGAARLFQTPRNLVSGIYHLARLLDPHPVGGYSAVAVGVAASRLLQGKRDFVPEVLDVLLANEAPEHLIGEIRRAPVWVRTMPTGGPAAAPEALLGTVFWALHHLASAPRVLDALVPLGPLARTIGRALLGARDGPPALAG